MLEPRKKETVIQIFAPMSGTVVAMAQVDDPIFSQEMLGKGVAIRPTDGRVTSPVTGTVSQMFDTGHAVALTSDDGVEILIHVGLDTVTLKGVHYTAYAKQGDKVSIGDILIECDLDAISASGFDTITPVAICNSDDFASFHMPTGNLICAGDEMMRLTKAT
ncbi:MAG: PTS glucose transporter subunit IIA [Oscillospiraceae bacterium]|nr:PTS glucose transporter subunit IIA [Oscillospiraceae bacterium]